MDFIKRLPKLEGYMNILVMVDKLTKQVVFVPTHNLIDVLSFTNLFIQNVFSKHGVPSHVTLDRGTKFVSKFFRLLAQALDMKLHFLVEYYPEADSQTECCHARQLILAI